MARPPDEHTHQPLMATVINMLKVLTLMDKIRTIDTIKSDVAIVYHLVRDLGTCLCSPEFDIVVQPPGQISAEWN